MMATKNDINTKARMIKENIEKAAPGLKIRLSGKSSKRMAESMYLFLFELDQNDRTKLKTLLEEHDIIVNDRNRIFKERMDFIRERYDETVRDRHDAEYNRIMNLMRENCDEQWKILKRQLDNLERIDKDKKRKPQIKIPSWKINNVRTDYSFYISSVEL